MSPGDGTEEHQAQESRSGVLTGVGTPCHTEDMTHTTVTQNRAHRNDIAWIKTTGRNFRIDGELYLSEYTNPWTGQAIRKGWRMTGQDWFIFSAAGEIVGRAHSLTWAKYLAKKEI